MAVSSFFPLLLKFQFQKETSHNKLQATLATSGPEHCQLHRVLHWVGKKAVLYTDFVSEEVLECTALII